MPLASEAIAWEGAQECDGSLRQEERRSRRGSGSACSAIQRRSPAKRPIDQLRRLNLPAPAVENLALAGCSSARGRAAASSDRSSQRFACRASLPLENADRPAAPVWKNVARAQFRLRHSRRRRLPPTKRTLRYKPPPQKTTRRAASNLKQCALAKPAATYKVPRIETQPSERISGLLDLR